MYHEFMKHSDGGPDGSRVAEPVQVYLRPADRERLDRLAERLAATKSDVLRRGLEALEVQTAPSASSARSRVALPTFVGHGLRPGIDLDETAALLDVMDD